MSLLDKVVELQKVELSKEMQDQLDRHQKAMDKLYEQGLERAEPERYRIPLDQRMAFSLAQK